MKRISLTLVLLATFLFMTLGGVVGCGPMHLNDTAKMWDAADPISKAVFFNEVYTEQWDEYTVVIAFAVELTPDEVEVMAKRDPEGLKKLTDKSKLSKDARQVLRYKKKILVALDKPIDIFSDLANVGLTPTPEQEKVIVELLNQLKYKAYTK